MSKKKINQKKISTAKKIVGFPFKLLKPVYSFLSQEIARLERKRRDIASRDPFNDTRRVVDNASSDTDVIEQTGHERTKALEKQISRKVVQMKKALSRIKIGRYGLCEKCNQMIDTDRLTVMPEATLCVKCEKKREE